MSHAFDELTRRAGRMRTRRSVLGLLGRSAAAAAFGGAGSLWLPTGAALAEDCIVEYPPADLDDCPNRRQRPGYLDTTAFCVTLGGENGFGWASFRGACRGRNVCYSTCNSNRGGCDQRYEDDVMDACHGAYPNRYFMELACIATASATKLGETSGSLYEKRQKMYCECCRPLTKPQCGCTGRRYETPEECLRDCKVGLGCFTDVCKPMPISTCA